MNRHNYHFPDKEIKDQKGKITWQRAQYPQASIPGNSGQNCADIYSTVKDTHESKGSGYSQRGKSVLSEQASQMSTYFLELKRSVHSHTCDLNITGDAKRSLSHRPRGPALTACTP